MTSEAQDGESWCMISNGWSFRKDKGSLFVGVGFNLQTTRSIMYLKREVGLSPGSVVGVARVQIGHLSWRLLMGVDCLDVSRK